MTYKDFTYFLSLPPSALSSHDKPIRMSSHPTAGINSGSVPGHVAIIMDGNGRWAKQRGLPRIEGHRRGVETVRTITFAARDLGIKRLTLYAFSVENWKRPQDEVGTLMSLLEYYLKKELDTFIRDKVRFETIGQIKDMPNTIRNLIEETQEKTKLFTDYTLVLALNYGARSEIVDATKLYTQAVMEGKENVDELSWNKLSHYLYTKTSPDPDLVIRTSGETRISNFLLLQAAYAEFIFTPVLWPDFTKANLAEAIEDFAKRERRYGLTSEQLFPKS
jgi:undecaprenyl diphosphate synthase